MNTDSDHENVDKNIPKRQYRSSVPIKIDIGLTLLHIINWRIILPFSHTKWLWLCNMDFDYVHRDTHAEKKYGQIF